PSVRFWLASRSFCGRGRLPTCVVRMRFAIFFLPILSDYSGRALRRRCEAPRAIFKVYRIGFAVGKACATQLRLRDRARRRRWAMRAIAQGGLGASAVALATTPGFGSGWNRPGTLHTARQRANKIRDGARGFAGRLAIRAEMLADRVDQG